MSIFRQSFAHEDRDASKNEKLAVADHYPRNHEDDKGCFHDVACTTAEV